METLVGWWSWAKHAAATHWVWVASISAATGLILTPLITDPDIRKAITNIGSVVLASGIAGAVIRSSTFTDMFIARIVDVFYEGKHLRSRNDMKEICIRTLNALLEAESPALRGAVGGELLNGYLDFKLGYVYREFSAQIEIESIDRESGVMNIYETTTATILPNLGVKEVGLRWSWISFSNTAAKAELLSVTIDGKNLDIESLRKSEEGGKGGSFVYSHKLESQTDNNDSQAVVYVKRVRKTIDLKRDPVTIYKFTAPCLGMSVTLLDLPEGLECEALAFGLPEEFQPDRLKSDGHGHWRSQKYSRLIFPKQGVMLQWSLLDAEQVQ